MQSVSAEFLTAAALPVKRRCKAKVDIIWTDPFIMTGITVETTDYNRVGDVGQDYYADISWHDPHLVDTKKNTPKKYLILDGTCTSDGTYHAMPTSQAQQQLNQVGWYSASIGDANGDFSPYPEVTVIFADPRPVKQISVVGEPTLGQYPVTFEVTILDSSDVELFNDEYTGTAVETLIDLTGETISSAKKMILTVKKWSTGNTMVKIVEFFGTVSDTFYGDDIVSIDVLEERELGNGTVPTGNISSNELDLDLQNIHLTRESGEEYTDPFFPDNPDSYVKNSLTPNVRIVPYLGFQKADGNTEYVKMGTFWSMDWNAAERDFSAQVTARDRMDLLRQVEFRSDEILENATLYEIAEAVLTHAKQNIPMNDLVWDIDTSLQSFTIPWSWFGKINYMEALAKIAEACMGHAYMDRDDVLRIESYTANSTKTADYTLTRDDYFTRTQKTNSSGLKNRIIVPVAGVEPEEEAAEILTTEDIPIGAGETDIEDYLIEWGDDAVIEGVAAVVNQSGVVMFITSSTFYPWGCLVSLHRASGTSGTFQIKITGKKLLSTTITEEILEDDDSIAVYGTREHKYNANPLLQDSTTAGVIAAVMLATYKDPRRDVTVDWRGNPATEIGDCAELPVYTPNTTGISITSNFLAYRQRFSFDGGLRCSLSARKGVDIV